MGSTFRGIGTSFLLSHSGRGLMTGATIFAFWGVAFALIMAPGADWAYTIAAGLRRGSVLPAVGGLITGHVLLVLLVAVGIGALVAASPVALMILTIAGAVYLLWIGIGMIRRPPEPEAGAVQVLSPAGEFFRGAGTSGFNPKVLLLLVTLLPQFVQASSGLAIPAQILVLGGIHIVTCAAVYLGVSLGARRVLSTRPRAARTIVRAAGVVVVAIGIFLLGEQVGGVLVGYMA